MRMSLNNKKEAQFSPTVGHWVSNVGIVPALASHAGVPTGNLGLRAFHRMRSVVLFAAQKSPLSMPSLTHALNIGTLAVWTSVATLGSLGAMLGRAGNFPVITDAVGVELVSAPLEIESVEMADGSSEAADPQASAESMELPAPPEMLPAMRSEVLPEVPEMPIAGPKKVFETVKRTDKPAVNATAASQKSVTSKASANGVASMSSAARLAAGRMPAPRYPSEARSKGQAGTVLIEFTVDPNGRVSSAHIATPCPWTLLNQEALRAVKNWKFPPGSAMTFKKPIVFKLRNS